MILKNFIVFEGIDGAGTSTQIKRLAEHFDNDKIFVTAEPTTAETGKFLRRMLKDDFKVDEKTAAFLFAADRSEHIFGKGGIIDQTEKGKIVISDRFYDSTTAYQGAARKLASNDVQWLNNFATEGLSPDLTIILDTPVEEGLRRANKRDDNNADRMGAQKKSFYEDVRSAFLKLAQQFPERIVVVSAMGSKEETFEKIVAVVESKIK